MKLKNHRTSILEHDQAPYGDSESEDFLNEQKEIEIEVESSDDEENDYFDTIQVAVNIASRKHQVESEHANEQLKTFGKAHTDVMISEEAIVSYLRRDSQMQDEFLEDVKTAMNQKAKENDYISLPLAPVKPKLEKKVKIIERDPKELENELRQETPSPKKSKRISFAVNEAIDEDPSDTEPTAANIPKTPKKPRKKMKAKPSTP